MRLKLSLTFIAILAFTACSKPKTSIRILCEKAQNGSYTIKWEVYPEMDEATVEIYASNNPNTFPTHPLKKTTVNKYIATIEKADSLNVKFFKLKINNTWSDVVTNRFYEFEDIQNFRDLGGYKTQQGKTIKWNKIYRSGEFSESSISDLTKLNKLNIQTIIDLRPRHIQEKRADKIDSPQRQEIYISGTSTDSISRKVLEDRFLRGDAIIYTQDLYEELFISQSEQYAKFFDYLAEEDNYPLVYHCYLGKDQSGVATYFLLRALGVSAEVAEDEYMLSNWGIDKSKIVTGIANLSESQQEAFVMLTRTDVSFLKYGLACAKKQEGSIEDYMENRLRLTREKKQKLRSILLD